MWDSCLDLMLGSGCVACARPGRVLCGDCRAGLSCRPRVSWPSPTPPGLALPTTAGEYDGALRLLVNAHKERSHFALAAPLGHLLASAVALHGRDGSGPLLLVPVPSRAAVVRARGHDPLLRVARVAAARLRDAGLDARCLRLLTTVRRVADQAGLGSRARATNLAGSMACAPRRARALLDRRPGAALVVVDDVLTTGATAREAQRAVEQTGLAVAGVATVAATRRRYVVPTEWDPSLPFCDAGD